MCLPCLVLRCAELSAEQDHFKQIGEVLRADVLQDRKSGRSKGVGVVEFKTVEDAQNAIATLNQSTLDGR